MPLDSAPPNLAVFADFENVAIGVRDANYEAFNIELVLERLLDKGKIVVKKAYADWDRYKSSRRAMHEASFELIEIPHVSYSGKNSADIRMVVDALDLCYTKVHVDVFVVISGDSDFSPLVSKLRENNKTVIGLGVKNSSSDLLIENCDEFIYYDDLVREKKRSGGRKGAKPRGSSNRDQQKVVQVGPSQGQGQAPPQAQAPREPGQPAATAISSAAPGSGASAAGPNPSSSAAGATGSPSSVPKQQAEKQGDKEEALELILDTVESLFQDREDAVWGSQVKQTLKRKRPNFSESYYGYRTFGDLLEDAATKGLLELQKDAKSGGWIVLGFGPNA